MPRCNLTLKQKCQIIELSGDLSTDQLAKKFRVHPTTVTRTVKNKEKILDQASRVNINFKTVQTNQRGEEHDTMILEYIRARQASNEPLTIKEICDKAVECAKKLDRNIKSQRGWWRRFKVRCNIIRSKLQKATPGPRLVDSTTNEKDSKVVVVTGAAKDKASSEPRKSPGKKSPSKKSSFKNYTFKVRDSTVHTTATVASVAAPPPPPSSNNNNIETPTVIITATQTTTTTADEVVPNVNLPTIQTITDMKPPLPDLYEAMA